MKIEQIEIPDQWCESLAQLQAVDPTAMIAGGAIRDLYTGHEVKDVDFFSTHLADWPDGHGSDLDYQGMQYVKAVQAYERSPHRYNIVIVDSVEPIALLDSFDFGACQIGFDGKQILRTQKFLWDVKYSTFTMRSIDRYPRSIQRYCRINQRYNWGIRIPALDTLNGTEQIEETF